MSQAIQHFAVMMDVENSEIQTIGGYTNVTVGVEIRTHGSNPYYAVSLWDYDFGPGDDPLTDRVVERVEGVEAGELYRAHHSFTLSCTKAGYVTGGNRDSEDSYAWVYAYGEEWDKMMARPALGGETAETSSVRVDCV